MNQFLSFLVMTGVFFGAPLSIAMGSPASSLGIDAQSSSRAMAVTASASPAAASASNPARLIDAQGIEMAMDIVVTDSNFKVQSKKADIDTYIGYQLGIAAQIPIASQKDRLFLGLSVHLPNDGLYEVRNSAISDIIILNQGSDARRFTLDAALAVRIYQRIALAAGLNIMPDVSADVNIDFTDNAQSSSSTVKVDYKFAPMIGIYAQPIEPLHLGFSYHAATRLQLDVPANVYVSESIGQIHTKLKGEAYAQPHTFSLGAKYDFSSLAPSHLLFFALHAQVDFLYHPYDIATSAEVFLYDEEGTVLSHSDQDNVSFKNAWHFRTALDWMPMDEITASLGYAYEQTCVPAQRTVFNVLDADRHLFSFGAEIWTPNDWLGGFQLGLAASGRFAFYDTRDVEKYEFMPQNPGFPSIRFEGYDFVFHASILMRFM